MFSLMPYTHGSIRLGKAKDVQIAGDLICIPLTLSFPYYNMDKLTAKLKIGTITIESAIVDCLGESSDDEEFSLDFRTRKVLLAVGYNEGNQIVFGTHVWHKYIIDHKPTYAVILEIRHFGKLINYAEYIITNLNSTFYIQDIKEENNV